MKQPVLFIIFNRLNTAQQVFAAIRAYQPERLYIAADGARLDKPDEKEQCEAVRNYVLNTIDWNCDVKTLFQPQNLGCGKAPFTAISWFFDNEEEGIILEDDCVPNQDFFRFCEQLLEYYRNNDRISIISGCNFDVNKSVMTENSYFYSVFPYTWGWATWRRNWIGYDYNLKEWYTIKKKKLLKSIFKKKKYYLAWQQTFDKLSNDKPKSIWDYQFFFQCFKRRQLSVVPVVNLVSNIGTGELATHTFAEESVMMKRPVEIMSVQIKHPLEIKRNKEYDVFLQKLNYGVVEQVSIYKKIKRLCKKYY